MDKLHSAVAHLPDAYYQLVPELLQIEPPAEKTSDCSNCPMLLQPGEQQPPVRAVFNPEVRCCTYNPVLYNFLVGRILRRGGRGAEYVRKRMVERDGVEPWAIRPPMSFYATAEKSPKAAFGRDVSNRCPYWAPEGLHCTIWEDRNAVCRSWFCKHDDGTRGADFWYAYRDLIRALQVKLCVWLADTVPYPEAETATEQNWVDYYIACADRLDRATPQELAAVDNDDRISDARELLRVRGDLVRSDDLPDKLGASVTAFYPVDEGVLLEGYSHYNPSVWPQGIYTLFSVMDGTVTWREALDLANQKLGSEVFAEADIRKLFRLGLVEPREPEDLVVGARLHGVPADRVTELSQDSVEFEWPFGS